MLHPAYSDGCVEFDDIELKVVVGTFVPIKMILPVARMVAEYLPLRGTLIDLGCGVGTVGLWVGVHRPDATVVGIDRNPLALEVARQNAHALDVDATFVEADGLTEALPGDLIANTLPYEGPEFWEGSDFDDGQPKDSYIADDSFALAMVDAHKVAEKMVVWALPTMAPVFNMTGWGQVVSEEDPKNNATTYLLVNREEHGGH